MSRMCAAGSSVSFGEAPDCDDSFLRPAVEAGLALGERAQIQLLGVAGIADPVAEPTCTGSDDERHVRPYGNDSSTVGLPQRSARPTARRCSGR